ncbi:unnamed protein product [Ixodes persulcatus]
MLSLMRSTVSELVSVALQKVAHFSRQVWKLRKFSQMVLWATCSAPQITDNIPGGPPDLNPLGDELVQPAGVEGVVEEGLRLQEGDQVLHRGAEVAPDRQLLQGQHQ